jgi:hypothetical protein
MIVALIKNYLSIFFGRNKLTKLIYSLILAFTSLVTYSQNPGWLPPVSSGFSNSASVISIIKLDGVVSNNADDRIAFFLGNEIRGLSQPVLIGPGQYIHFITVYSNINIEYLNIKVYHKNSNQVYEVLSPFQFQLQNIYGSIGAPYEVNIYTDNNAPLGFLNVPVQQTIQGLPFNDINMSNYLVQPDPYPVTWSYVTNPNLIVGFVGSILKVQGSPGFTGQTQLIVKATEIRCPSMTVVMMRPCLMKYFQNHVSGAEWTIIPIILSI